MMSKAQNGVEALTISEPVPTVSKPVELEPSSFTPVEDISSIKSPSGVRNMQESTLDKERKLPHKLNKILSLNRFGLLQSLHSFSWLSFCFFLHLIAYSSISSCRS